MKKISAKKWMKIYLCFQGGLLGIIATIVIMLDPFFHYHKPLKSFYYTLDSLIQVYLNDGIVKQFDYDAIITGTSMTENFRTTEVDEIFSVNSIKVPFSGGCFKEINDNLERALNYNPNIEVIIRGLDGEKFFDNKDTMRFPAKNYPSYLYNEVIFDDVKYIFNRDVIFNRCWSMIEAKLEGQEGGITSFDNYSRWMDMFKYRFTKEDVLGERKGYQQSQKILELTEEDRENIQGNIFENVIRTAEEHPATDFYYFIPPYSIAWWGELKENGNILRQLEAEKMVIKMILECDNIKLFSFNNCYEITTNLNNYKDLTHYSEEISSFILNCMMNGNFQLTKENYMQYLQKEKEFYYNFDYNGLFEN